jgi:hypothetical protein
MAEVLLAAVALVVAAISEVALAPRQHSTAVAFEAPVTRGCILYRQMADQVPHLDSIMVVIACLPCDAGTPRSVGRPEPVRRQLPATPATKPRKLIAGKPLQIREFRLRQIVSQCVGAGAGRV